MNDLISRHGVSAWLYNLGYPKLADIVMNEQRFPSAQPVRKTGQWIKRKKGAIGYNCSCCGKSDISNHFDYCPNCGADMRGEEDE